MEEKFLQNKKQCVKIGEELSSRSNVISGVPEGSVCGPILYNIYVNDLPLAVKFCKIVVYADDVRLHITGDIPNANENMMIDLTNISQWAELCQLKLNNKKCSVLHIGSRNPNYVYLLNNVPITNVHEMKDLGITVNDCLCFDSYIDTVVAKAYRIC